MRLYKILYYLLTFFNPFYEILLYAWSAGAIPVASTNTATVTAAATYTVTVTETLTGCTATANVTVANNIVPPACIPVTITKTK